MPDTAADTEPSELQEIIRWRYHQACQAGLTRVEARLFAESDTDIGLLRQLVAAGCPAQLIARIVI